MLCAKSMFFSASVEQDERRQSLVWVSTPQSDNLFCFLFSGTIIVGLIWTPISASFKWVSTCSSLPHRFYWPIIPPQKKERRKSGSKDVCAP